MFNKLNNLTDEKGQVVDVYINIASNLQNESGQTANGRSTINFDGNNFISMYGVNTTLIELNSNLMDFGRYLSHEGGHTFSGVKFLNVLNAWYNQYPSARRGNGHDEGNPSGDYATEMEKVYMRNKGLKR